MSNIEYVIDSSIEIPRINMSIESENTGENHILPIEDISVFYEIISYETLKEYLECIENKMIEYVSGIVYEKSSQEYLLRLSTLINIRDSLKTYLSLDNNN